eukprot:581221_1
MFTGETTYNRTCGPDTTTMGVWDGSGAVCQPLEGHCDPLSPPVNGMIALTNRSINGEASYTCNFGYFTSDGSQEIMPVIRSCQQNADWTGQAPLCIPRRAQWLLYLLDRCYAHMDTP